jgi:hypothetical protein
LLGAGQAGKKGEVQCDEEEDSGAKGRHGAAPGFDNAVGRRLNFADGTPY